MMKGWTKHTVNTEAALALPPFDYVTRDDFPERRAMGAQAQALAAALGLSQPHLWVWAAWGKLTAAQEAQLRAQAGDIGVLAEVFDMLVEP